MVDDDLDDDPFRTENRSWEDIGSRKGRDPFEEADRGQERREHRGPPPRRDDDDEER